MRNAQEALANVLELGRLEKVCVPAGDDDIFQTRSLFDIFKTRLPFLEDG
jgi:hypothetical protein